MKHNVFVLIFVDFFFHLFQEICLAYILLLKVLISLVIFLSFEDSSLV